MGKKGRPLRPGEKLSEVRVPHSNEEGRPASDGVDIWKVITDPSRPGRFTFWFDRTEGEELHQVDLS